jgi:hypothetical protein
MAVVPRAVMPPAVMAVTLRVTAVMAVTLRTPGTAARVMPRALVVAVPPQATTLPVVPTVLVQVVIRPLAEPALVQMARPTVPRVVQQTRVQAMLAAVLVVSVRVVAPQAALRPALLRPIRIQVLPVAPRIAEPVVPVGRPVPAAEPAELVVTPIAELAGMPIAEPVVPGTAVLAVTRLVDPRAPETAAARPVVSVPEQLRRLMQRVTPTAVPVVRRIPEPVVRARAVRRRLPRPRVAQGLSVVPRIAAPAVRRLVVLAVPAE